MEHGNDIFAMYILIWNTTKIPLPCANFYKTRERSYFPLLSSRFFPVIFFLSVSAHGKACQTWHHPLAWNSVNRIFVVFRAGRHATKATPFSEQKDTRQRSFAVPFIIVLSLPCAGHGDIFAVFQKAFTVYIYNTAKPCFRIAFDASSTAVIFYKNCM
jgi:hypothetical protein